MEHSTLRRLTVRIVAGAAIIGLLLATAPTSAQSVTPAQPAAASVTGQGFWSTLACVACVTGFLVAGGTTVVGVAAIVAANPEIAVACTVTCVEALS